MNRPRRSPPSRPAPGFLALGLPARGWCVLPLALLLAGCSAFGGRTDAEQQRLEMFQRNATQYYDAQRFPQALEQVEKGLEIEPDDYLLLSLRGWCHLSTANRDRDALRRAEAAFDQLWPEREPDAHSRSVLFGYARVKQEIGLWHASEAETAAVAAKDPLATPTERTVSEAAAGEHRRRAESYWASAEEGYEALVERQEVIRLAYKGLMELAVERGRYQPAVDFGRHALERIAAEQAEAQAVIAEVYSLREERLARRELRDLVDQERKIRAALAEMHFRQQEYRAAIAELDVLLTSDVLEAVDTYYYNRALAYERIGEHEAARADYDRFIRTSSLPSTDERVIRAKEMLRGTPGPTADAER